MYVTKYDERRATWFYTTDLRTDRVFWENVSLKSHLDIIRLFNQYDIPTNLIRLYYVLVIYNITNRYKVHHTCTLYEYNIVIPMLSF